MKIEVKVLVIPEMLQLSHNNYNTETYLSLEANSGIEIFHSMSFIHKQNCSGNEDYQGNEHYLHSNPLLSSIFI